MPSRLQIVLGTTKSRSRLTNGHALPRSVDLRSSWARRFKDLLAIDLADISPDPTAVSAAEAAILQRACTLICECERMEERFARNGQATLEELEVFQRASNTMRRHLESLGLKRRQRDVTPSVADYVRHINAQEAAK